MKYSVQIYLNIRIAHLIFVYIRGVKKPSVQYWGLWLWREGKTWTINEYMNCLLWEVPLLSEKFRYRIMQTSNNSYRQNRILPRQVNPLGLQTKHKVHSKLKIQPRYWQRSQLYACHFTDFVTNINSIVSLWMVLQYASLYYANTYNQQEHKYYFMLRQYLGL
mgnify:CR=1 FL=1